MAHFAKFVDMQKTPEQVNEEVSANAAPMTAKAENVPKYPWGLCINLEDDQLDKLGIDGECEVGDQIHLCAMAKVTSCSENETEGKTRHRIELQITHLAVEDEDAENERQDRRSESMHKRYGADKDEAA
jgi:hypothetical protein